MAVPFSTKVHGNGDKTVIGRGTQIVVCLITFLAPSLLRADVFNLGVVSFVTAIPGALGLAGVNTFDIDNFTGDPITGGFALPPDFPSLTAVTFKNSSLTVQIGNTKQVILLGDIGPGTLDFFTIPALGFPDFTQISSATFTTTLDVQSQLLADGSIFQDNSAQISTLLTDSSAGVLVADSDSNLITVSNVLLATPEPANWLMLATIVACVFGLFVLSRRKRISS